MTTHATAAAEQRHGRTLVVWNVPSAIGRGEAFRIVAGVRCEAGCPPRGWAFEVRDDAGGLRATARPAATPWPGTESLYAATIELVAPEREGLYRWEITAPAAAPPEPQTESQTESLTEREPEWAPNRESAPTSEDTPAPAHEAACASFAVRVSPPADSRIRVVAVDSENGAPIAGARVVVHPYRTVTDARGVAELELPRGVYRLFVSGTGFFPFRHDGELGGDATIRAELRPDRGPSDAEVWS